MSTELKSAPAATTSQSTTKPNAEASVPGMAKTSPEMASSQVKFDVMTMRRTALSSSKPTMIPDSLRKQILEEMLAPITNPRLHAQFREYADEYITCKFTIAKCAINGQYREMNHWIERVSLITRFLSSLSDIGEFEIDRIFTMELGMDIRMGDQMNTDEELNPALDILNTIKNSKTLEPGSTVPATGRTVYIPDMGIPGGEQTGKIDGGLEQPASIPKTADQAMEELQTQGDRH
jgi:hypothetical protein